MKILLTGAFGIVGREVLNHLIDRNYDVRIFEIINSDNKVKSRNYKDNVELFWGDIRNKDDVIRAVEGIDVVIHLAAIIPPLADKKPDLAYEVNVGG
ncbi:MAG: NAD-dependent epimerase/dehydratase family protein, partial [Promethearchaeota archaeon]